jgi:hypothetical protein
MAIKHIAALAPDKHAGFRGSRKKDPEESISALSLHAQ